MKKRLICVLFSLLSIAATAQTEIRELYENLVDECQNIPAKGVRSMVSITNDHGIRRKTIHISGYRYHIEPKRDANGNIIESALNPDTLKGVDKYAYEQYAASEEIISKIERILETTRQATDELYWWEKHQDGQDSVMVSLAYRNRTYDKAPQSRTFQGHTHYVSAEFADYSYYSQKLKFIDGLTGTGVFSLNYNCQVDSVGEPFDPEAYMQSVQHLLQDKHIEQRPIKWIHDETYSEMSKSPKDTHYKSSSYSNGIPDAGSTTGTLYTLKPKKEGDEEAIRLKLEQFLEHTEQYIIAHPEQQYNYSSHRYSCFQIFVSNGSLWSLLSGITKDHSKFEIRITHDDEGYHILQLHTIGSLWIPKHYSTLESIYNDKEVFIKGKEPKKE